MAEKGPRFLNNSWSAVGKITKISKSNNKDLWVIYIVINHKAPRYENRIAVPICFVSKFDPNKIVKVGDKVRAKGVFVPSNNKNINYNLMVLNMHKIENRQAPEEPEEIEKVEISENKEPAEENS